MVKQLLLYVALLVISAIHSSRAEMEAFVVGANFTEIKEYPHSAFLSISCKIEGTLESWMCGSSILNQDILLTAAHCLENCVGVKTRVAVKVGHENRLYGMKSSARSFKMHDKYEYATTACDIALVAVKTKLNLNDVTARVAVLRNPPYNEQAYVAGWGRINEIEDIGTKLLKFTNQTVWDRENCTRILGPTPVGTFCAGSVASESYASTGDSGSALIVRGYIQIGIVSHKIPQITRSLTVYTDVGHFYNWIVISARKIYCH